MRKKQAAPPAPAAPAAPPAPPVLLRGAFAAAAVSGPWWNGVRGDREGAFMRGCVVVRMEDVESMLTCVIMRIRIVGTSRERRNGVLFFREKNERATFGKIAGRFGGKKKLWGKHIFEKVAYQPELARTNSINQNWRARNSHPRVTLTLKSFQQFFFQTRHRDFYSVHSLWIFGAQ